jgi:hypothetical protein
MRCAAVDGDLVPLDGRDQREVLVDYIAVLRSTTSLLDLDIPSPFGTVVRTDAQHDEPRPLTSTAQSDVCPDGHRYAEADHSAPADVRSDAHQDIPPIEPAAALSEEDLWRQVAEKICADHPARWRHRAKVEAILRLHHIEHRMYPEIAHQVGLSKHAVGRVIRQARPYHPIQAPRTHPGGERDAA